MFRVATKGLQRSWLGQLVGLVARDLSLPKDPPSPLLGTALDFLPLSPSHTHVVALPYMLVHTYTHRRRTPTLIFTSDWFTLKPSTFPSSTAVISWTLIGSAGLSTWRSGRRTWRTLGQAHRAEWVSQRAGKSRLFSGSVFVPGGTTWLACQPVSWASWFCTFSRVYSWVALGMSHRLRVIPQGSWPPHTAPTHPEFRMPHTLDFKDSEWERAHWFFVMLATEMACLEMYWIK